MSHVSTYSKYLERGALNSVLKLYAKILFPPFLNVRSSNFVLSQFF